MTTTAAGWRCWPSSSSPGSGCSRPRCAWPEAPRRTRRSADSSRSTPSSATGSIRPRPSAVTTSEFSTDISINARVCATRRSARSLPANAASWCSATRWCWPCRCRSQQTFCKRLERRLNGRGGATRYRVINAGVQGYGPVEERCSTSASPRGCSPTWWWWWSSSPTTPIEASTRRGRLDAPAVCPWRRADGDRAHDCAASSRRSVVLQIAPPARGVSSASGSGRARGAPEPPRGDDTATPAPTYITEGLEVVAAGARRACRASVPAVGRTHGHRADAGAFSDRSGGVRAPAGGRRADGRRSLELDGATERFRAALAPLGLPTLDLLPALRAAAGTATCSSPAHGAPHAARARDGGGRARCRSSTERA